MGAFALTVFVVPVPGLVVAGTVAAVRSGDRSSRRAAGRYRLLAGGWAGFSGGDGGGGSCGGRRRGRRLLSRAVVDGHRARP